MSSAIIRMIFGDSAEKAFGHSSAAMRQEANRWTDRHMKTLEYEEWEGHMLHDQVARDAPLLITQLQDDNAQRCNGTSPALIILSR